MAKELIASNKKTLQSTAGGMPVPAIIAGAGGEAGKRFLEFFAAQPERETDSVHSHGRTTHYFARGLWLPALVRNQQFLEFRN